MTSVSGQKNTRTNPTLTGVRIDDSCNEHRLLSVYLLVKLPAILITLHCKHFKYQAEIWHIY